MRILMIVLILSVLVGLVGCERSLEDKAIMEYQKMQNNAYKSFPKLREEVLTTIAEHKVRLETFYQEYDGSQDVSVSSLFEDRDKTIRAIYTRYLKVSKTDFIKQYIANNE